jgi:hypothetical protein
MHKADTGDYHLMSSRHKTDQEVPLLYVIRDLHETHKIIIKSQHSQTTFKMSLT